MSALKLSTAARRTVKRMELVIREYRPRVQRDLRFQRLIVSLLERANDELDLHSQLQTFADALALLLNHAEMDRIRHRGEAPGHVRSGG